VKHTKKIVLTGLMTALVFLLTFSLKILTLTIEIALETKEWYTTELPMILSLRTTTNLYL